MRLERLSVMGGRIWLGLIGCERGAEGAVGFSGEIPSSKKMKRLSWYCLTSIR